jgi:hypothetical protein
MENENLTESKYLPLIYAAIFAHGLLALACVSMFIA